MVDTAADAPIATYTAESVTSTDEDLDLAILQATAGAALVPVIEYLPRQDSRNDSGKMGSKRVSIKLDASADPVIMHKSQKKRSLFAALMSHGAHAGSTATPPTSIKYPVHSSVSDKQSAFENMQKFFSDLANWRSTNKIYAESAQE